MTGSSTYQNGDSVIRLTSVGKTFQQRGADVQALENVDLEVKRGEFLVLVGASGCGKTTLLNIVARLLQPTMGQIEISPESDRPGGIGMVFQSPVLLPWRTLLSNVMVPAEVLGLGKAEAQERAMDLLALVGLRGFEHAHPYQLSGGMQQRAALCRALLSRPPLLLMDEPFGALDAITRENLNVELQRIWAAARSSVVFVTHSITEAIFLSDRIVVMSRNPGRVAMVLRNDLERPRTVQAFKSDLFAEYSVRVRERIQAEMGTVE
jgi:NitT/TauT family transport system ATP-binding protein